MSAARTITLDISILGREFKVACKARELARGMESLDQRMREIRDAGKVSGTDRIAIMAALNFAHELLRERRGAAAAEPPSSVAEIDGDEARRRIQSMQTAIDQALAGQEKLF